METNIIIFILFGIVIFPTALYSDNV